MSACLVYDPFGAEQIERIGVGRVLAEADYPHPDCTFPGMVEELRGNIAGLPAADQERILGRNAVDLYRLPGF